MSETKNAKFSSRWGFILSAVGSAVGMANVWGFPAKVGANGGGAFLIAYLIFIVLFSIVGLSAEYAIGRRAKTG
ncbi:MAG: sodium-dependent transporter, partial [Oscillospiraceae bacterium]|nr:sodium-dependent transporter [Oscillospiraceae bacterium]